MFKPGDLVKVVATERELFAIGISVESAIWLRAEPRVVKRVTFENNRYLIHFREQGFLWVYGEMVVRARVKR